MLTTGEHEYTRYGFRQLLERKCVGVYILYYIIPLDTASGRHFFAPYLGKNRPGKFENSPRKMSTRCDIHRVNDRIKVSGYLFNFVDILQPDITWLGGLTEARRVVNMASAYDIMVVPHGSSVFSYHLQYAFQNCPMAEYLMMSPKVCICKYSEFDEIYLGVRNICMIGRQDCAPLWKFVC